MNTFLSIQRAESAALARATHNLRIQANAFDMRLDRLDSAYGVPIEGFEIDLNGEFDPGSG